MRKEESDWFLEGGFLQRIQNIQEPCVERLMIKLMNKLVSCYILRYSLADADRGYDLGCLTGQGNRVMYYLS